MAGLFDLEALRETPLIRDPFAFVVVPEFLNREARPLLDADFPRIAAPGSFPVGALEYGPAFASLLQELRGPEFEAAVSEKFGIELSRRPVLITVRGRCRRKDGQVHTDAAWKIVTVLLYLNDRWEHGGAACACSGVETWRMRWWRSHRHGGRSWRSGSLTARGMGISPSRGSGG